MGKQWSWTEAQKKAHSKRIKAAWKRKREEAGKPAMPVRVFKLGKFQIFWG